MPPSRPESALAKALDAHRAGRLDDAERDYRAVLKREPTQLDALYLLGLLLHQSGRSREALVPLERAVTRAPHRAEFLNSLGDAHRTLGEFDAAETRLREALTVRPDYPDAQENLARTLYAAGRGNDALVLLFNAVAANPAHAPFRHLLAGMLQGVVMHTGNAVVREVLRLLLTDDQLSAQSVAGAVLGLVRNTDAYRAVLASSDAGTDPFLNATDAVQALMQDTLLETALPRILVLDAEIERVLTHVRRWIVQRSVSTDGRILAGPTVPTAFLAALAAQCFNTEYAWMVAPDEQQHVERLHVEIEAALDASTDASQHTELESALLCYALHQPLHHLRGWERLAALPTHRWSEALAPLVRDQLTEHADEVSRAAALPAVTAIANDTSSAVRAMYEANPYPRWVSLQRPATTRLDAFVRSLRPDGPVPTGSTGILVAGAGTGQQPIQMALTFPDARVLAVDLSRTSLAYGARMAARLGVERVTFAQGDLLALDASLGSFAVISCSGVLHHLRSPLDGWRHLVGLLAPGGVMKVGLYSTRARTGITAAQSFVREHGFTPDVAGIRAARQALMALPAAHPARAALTFTDFYSVSGCRDLLMHVQERSYTIPEIAESLAQLDLEFLGFQLPQPVQAAFQREAGASALRDLAAWDQFEQRHPETFAAMYQFWCAPRSSTMFQ